MLYFALRAFGFLITNINIKITIYCSPSLLSFSILSLLFLNLSSISLPSSLHISPHSLLSLSHFAACVRSFHCPRITSCTFALSSPSFPFLFSLSRPHLCNPLSFFSLTHSLPSLLYSLTYLCLCRSTFLFTFRRRVVFLFSPSRKFASVSPIPHPI
jgi:hypothetical protein